MDGYRLIPALIKVVPILTGISTHPLAEKWFPFTPAFISAQKFSKAVSFGHNQEFIHSDKEEQEIAESCRRLIKNAIICWNYLYLSQKLYEADSEERKAEILNAIRDGSVVTWQHVNLHGEYDFSDEKLQDSIGLDLTKIEGLPRNGKREGEHRAK